MSIKAAQSDILRLTPSFINEAESINGNRQNPTKFIFECNKVVSDRIELNNNSDKANECQLPWIPQFFIIHLMTASTANPKKSLQIRRGTKILSNLERDKDSLQFRE